MENKLKYTLAVYALIAALLPVSAKVILPHFFTDNMVIQQNSTLVLPGQARPGRTVTATAGWSDRKFTAKAAGDGSFRIEIPTPQTGGPYTLTLSDGEKRTFGNILIGEVWICSGQSNMEMPVAGWGKVNNYEQETANARYPSIRLLQIKKTIALAPEKDVEVNMGGWQPCSPSSVPEFSSVAYFYARDLWKELKVPIGVIDCTWGGTSAEAWTSLETLAEVIGYRQETDKMQRLGFDRNLLTEAYQKELTEWRQMVSGQAANINNLKEWNPMELPSFWENRGLFNVDGIVWFRKEVEIPVTTVTHDIVLHLGMIDDEDITYFNGAEIARGQGFKTPRHYKIPKELIRAGKNEITVRIADFGGEGGIHGETEELYIENGNQHISLAGNWEYQIGATLNDLPVFPMSPESANHPTVLYNAMVHPLTILPIKGVIWYQGENNVGRDRLYAPLFQSLIAGWRKQWRTDFPFYFVQLAGYTKPQTTQPYPFWALLREAQAEALHLVNTGMAVTTDIGNPNDIHPKNKQEVARRLSLLALANTYGKNVTAEAPILRDYRISGQELILTFNSELKARETAIKGFILAGTDGIFHHAKVRQPDNTTLILQSDDVAIPMAARYNWTDCPDGNLYGATGLPIAPFRTDKLE